MSKLQFAVSALIANVQGMYPLLKSKYLLALRALASRVQALAYSNVPQGLAYSNASQGIHMCIVTMQPRHSPAASPASTLSSL